MSSSLASLRQSLSQQAAAQQGTMGRSPVRSPVSAAPVAPGGSYRTGMRPKSLRETGQKQRNHAIAYVLWFIIVFLLTWIILYAFGPQFVVSNDEIDQSKVILWSVVIALIVVAIVAIVYTEQRAGQKLISLNF